jgi:hypothetical protein
MDLTEENNNGKNSPINEYLYAEKVKPTLSGKDEYLLYRNILKGDILHRDEFEGVDIKTVLHAREAGLVLLKSNVGG